MGYWLLWENTKIFTKCIVAEDSLSTYSLLNSRYRFECECECVWVSISIAQAYRFHFWVPADL